MTMMEAGKDVTAAANIASRLQFMERKWIKWRHRVVCLMSIALTVVFGLALAWASQLGPQTNYSAAQIQAAVEAAPGYNANLEGDAGGLGEFESNGNTGVYNGSCCTGVFQMNTSNLASLGLTRSEYANESLQQQADQWVQITNNAANSKPVQELESMQTFDGQPVNSNLVLACIQLGTGNCQKMINSGSCSGFSDINGTTICKMANQIGAKSGQPNAQQQQQAQQNQSQTSTTQPNHGAATSTSQTQAQSTSGQALSNYDASLNYAINLNGISLNPESPGAGGSMMNIGDPTTCWICDAALYSMGAIEQTVTTATPEIVQMVWPLMVVFVGVALLMRIGGALIMGKSPIIPVIRWLPKVVFVFALFMGGVIAPFGTNGTSGGITSDPGINTGLTDTGVPGSSVSIPSANSLGSTDSGSLLFDYFLTPPLQLGSALGTDIATAAQSALGAQLPQQTCNHDSLSAAKIQQLLAAANAVLTLACEVHEAAAVAILVGGIVATHPEADQTITDQATGVVLFFCGAGMMLLAFMSLVNFGFALIEVILKLGLVAVFMPLLIFMWLFNLTRRSVMVLFTSAFFSFLFLALSGAASIVMIFIVLTAISYGLGVNGTGTLTATSTLTVQNVMSQFDQLASGMGLTTDQGIANMAKFICFSAAGSLLAGRVLRAAHDMAVEVSEFGLGQRGEMANVGRVIASRVMSVGTTVAAVGISGASRLAGDLAGRQVGRMMAGRR